MGQVECCEESYHNDKDLTLKFQVEIKSIYRTYILTNQPNQHKEICWFQQEPQTEK